MKRMLFAFVALLLIGSPDVLAQLTTATISGTIKDSSGGVLPGVAVTVKHVETGISRSVVTDADGTLRGAKFAAGRLRGARGAVGIPAARAEAGSR